MTVFDTMRSALGCGFFKRAVIQKVAKNLDTGLNPSASSTDSFLLNAVKCSRESIASCAFDECWRGFKEKCGHSTIANIFYALGWAGHAFLRLIFLYDRVSDCVNLSKDETSNNALPVSSLVGIVQKEADVMAKNPDWWKEM
ncbi:MAG: hypothetical protein LBP65_02895 [Puniceicoccales bacterium]|jgi:hypothetical protein|nr:hypothetical protein [Puniceicoccales bacterium]